MTAAEKILEALKLVIGKDVNEFAIPVINTIIKAHESEEKVSLREEIERLKLEFDCEWNAREKLDADNQILLSKINDLREALRESISYIEGRNHGIEGVSLLDRCRKLIGD